LFQSLFMLFCALNRNQIPWCKFSANCINGIWWISTCMYIQLNFKHKPMGAEPQTYMQAHIFKGYNCQTTLVNEKIWWTSIIVHGEEYLLLLTCSLFDISYYFIEIVLLFLKLIEAVHPLHDDKLVVPLLIGSNRGLGS
jgi:hypothetical protein